MNIAVKNTLRSIIAKHGTDIAYNPRLCDAILSDLMSDYPTERRLLIRSVTAGIPATLLAGQEPKRTAPAGTSDARRLSLEADAMATELWRHALQDRLPAPITHRRHARSYLSGMITTLVIMTISSAIAFYKHSNQNDPLAETLSRQGNIPAIPLSGPETTTPPENPAPPMQVASVDMQSLPLLDELKIVKLQLPSLPLKQESLNQATEQAVDTAIEQAEQQELQRMTAQAARALANQFLATAEHQVLQEVTMQAARELAAKELAAKELAARAAVQRRQAEAERQRQAAEAARQLALRETTRQQQASQQTRLKTEETRITLKALLLDSVSFGREMVSLEKKRTDLKTLQNLYKLTGENFYATQMLMVNSKISSLEKNLNTLSANYTEKMNSLCKVSPRHVSHSLQSLSDNGRSAGMESVAHQLLSRHVRTCQNHGQAVAGNIKNELMASYGRLIRQ